jgi:DNA modification methylase
VRWHVSTIGNPIGRAMADRHYNRQKVGSRCFVAPGRALVLRADGALWVSIWQMYANHAWAGAWVNSIFRREERSPHLATDLILDAVAATRWRWPVVPAAGMVTFIDEREVKPTLVRGRNVYGWTYRKVGFRETGRSGANDLLVLQLLPEAMPPPRAALGHNLSLFEEADRMGESEKIPRFFLGDCIEGMSDLPDRSIDHFITDPPYAPRAMRNVKTHGMIKERRDGVMYDFGYVGMTPKLRLEAAREMARLARRWVLVWSDVESMDLWRDVLEDAGLSYVRYGYWWRENGAPQFTGDRPAQGVEGCVIMHGPERMAWNGGGRPALWKGPISRGNARPGHSTPKPEWLMDAQVREFTDPGDLVCDPFVGSGTTGVSCVKLGRRFIGWELRESFHEEAAKRLASAKEQIQIVEPSRHVTQPKLISVPVSRKMEN